MNPTSVDIKDILVAEGGFTFGTDLFIGAQPPTPLNCVTLFDTTTSPPDGTIDGNNVFFQEGLMVWVRNESYEAAFLQAQGIISLLHNRAGFTQNETFYLYCNLQSGPNALGEGDDEEGTILTLNFNLQRKSGIVPAADFLTFTKLVLALVAGTGVILEVNELNQTLTINSEGGGGGVLMRNNGMCIQYSNDGGTTWSNIISIAEITGQAGQDGSDGADGREVEFNKSATHIQWRYVGDSVWIDLVALVDLKGDKGDQGDPAINYTRLVETCYAPTWTSFFGFAPVGSAQDVPVWTITKQVSSASGVISEKTITINYKWTDRYSL
jgi:hypothetical protein